MNRGILVYYGNQDYTGTTWQEMFGVFKSNPWVFYKYTVSIFTSIQHTLLILQTKTNDHDRKHNSPLRNIYFQVPKLTRIHEEPTFPQLQLLFNQIKANASPVKINLGGKIHGHLGLVFSLEDYEEFSPVTPYGRPLITEPLRITTNINKNQRLQYEFKEACKLYRETVDVEKSLTKKIVATIEKNTFKLQRIQ